MIIFFKSVLTGITMALPVGPLAVLCIRRSLRGHREGLATALGISLADGTYGLIAALGLNHVSTFILTRKEYLFSGGGLLLLFLGIRTFKNPPPLEKVPLKQKGFVTTLLQTMALTFSNPMTLVTFIAVFSAVGFEDQYSTQEALSISFGVFIGSLSWFLSLTALILFYKKRLSNRVLWLINTFSGTIFLIGGTLFILNAAGIL